MSLQARFYISLNLCLGAVILTSSAGPLGPMCTPQLAAYLLIAGIVSALHVELPGVSVSPSFLCTFVALVELGLPQALAVASLATLVQSFWRPSRKPALVRVAFSLSSIAVSVWCGYHAFVLPTPRATARPLALLLMATVYFLANVVQIAVVVYLTRTENGTPGWKSTYGWLYMYYLGGACIAGLFSLVDHFLGWHMTLLTLPIAYLVYRSHLLSVQHLNNEKRIADEQRKHAQEMADLHLRTIKTLATAIEAKDETTYEHLERVQVYALGVGEELGLSADELQALRSAAILHDIGKLAVPEYIISKPGKLTAEEFNQIKVHPIVGAEIITHAQFPYDVAPIVRAHHEKWDGSGYPDGLTGEQIPLSARILTAVDVLDALSSDRQYRKAMPLDDAMCQLEREAGTSFDPRVVAVLKRRYTDLEQQAREAIRNASRFSIAAKVERGAAPGAGLEGANIVLPPFSTDSLRHGLLSLDKALTTTGDAIPQAFMNLARTIEDAMPGSAVVLYAPNGSDLEPRYSAGALCGLRVPVALGKGVSGWVALNRRPILNGNPSAKVFTHSNHQPFANLHSAVSVPVESGGRLVGVLTLYNQRESAFQKDHLRLLEDIASRLVPALAPPARTLTPTQHSPQLAAIAAL